MVFPYLDLAYFILQVALARVFLAAGEECDLCHAMAGTQSTLGLTEREARALVRLAMFDAYSRREG